MFVFVRITDQKTKLTHFVSSTVNVIVQLLIYSYYCEVHNSC